MVMKCKTSEPGLIEKIIGFMIRGYIRRYRFRKWLMSADTGKYHDFASVDEPCPCCDYVTLPEPGISYKCPVCYWEDEGDGMDKPDVRSRVNNGLTLRQARENFKQYGACSEEMTLHVEPVERRKKFEYLPRDL